MNPKASGTLVGSVLLAGSIALSCSRALPEGGATKDPAASVVAVTPVTPAPPAARAAEPVPAAEPAVAGEAVDERFASELKAVFATYKSWGRVDDEVRWAPFLCRIPEPGRPAMSAAQEGGHARKLYSLFAKDRNAYVGAKGAKPATAVGQVIVKESYVPEVVEARPGRFGGGGTGGGIGGSEPVDHFDPYTTHEGVTYRASTLAGVYVMLHKAPSTPGTDEGWIYGTLKPNGELTSAGRVSSCMGCHTAKPGRLFGRNAS